MEFMIVLIPLIIFMVVGWFAYLLIHSEEGGQLAGDTIKPKRSIDQISMKELIERIEADGRFVLRNFEKVDKDEVAVITIAYLFILEYSQRIDPDLYACCRSPVLSHNILRENMIKIMRICETFFNNGRKLADEYGVKHPLVHWNMQLNAAASIWLYILAARQSPGLKEIASTFWNLMTDNLSSFEKCKEYLCGTFDHCNTLDGELNLIRAIKRDDIFKYEPHWINSKKRSA